MSLMVRFDRVATVTLVALLSLACGPAAVAQQRPAPLNPAGLIAPEAAGGVMVNPIDDRVVARRRPIAFDPAALQHIRAGRNVTLNLFDDVALPAIHDRSWHRTVNTFIWQGHVPGDAPRTVTIVLHKNAVWASIEARGVGRFRIRAHAGLGQVAEEVREEQFPPCGCGPQQEAGNRPIDAGVAQAQRVDPNAAARDDGGLAGENCLGAMIDVMVVYTPQARDLEGGTENIEALCFGLEAVTNNAYINSDVAQRIDIAHVAEVDYVESGSFSTELHRLTNTSDGHMDAVHALRDQHGADLVALLISHTQNGTICGIAWLMGQGEVNSGFAQYGFSVTNTNCAQGGFTFEHELGHNMGCHHDHDNSGPAGAFTWSHGHRFTASDSLLYRTIMSYSPGNRIAHFSNPDVLYLDTPTGVPIGTTGTEADNAATLDATASAVASFRTPPPMLLDDPPTWPEPVQFIAGDPNPDDRFGISVAISGPVMIVGAYHDDEAATNAGAAYIFRFNPATGQWQQQQKLMAPDAAAVDRFGISVDVVSSAEGDVAVVGAYFDDTEAGIDTGSAYVFRSTGGGEWTFQQRLTAADAVGSDLFGRSVAIARSGSSDVIVVGSFQSDAPGAANCGAAYVFRSTGGGAWTQEQKLLNPEPAAFDAFGQSVDIGVAPDNSQWLIVGCWMDDNAGAANSGSAFVYQRAGTWQQAAKLVAADAAVEDQAGFDVALSFVDSTRLSYVGAFKANAPQSNSGAVYVFSNTPPATTWTQEAKLTAADGQAEDHLGTSVDADGSAVLVGAYLDDEGGLDTGSAFVFRRSGVGWVQEAKIVAPNPVANDNFGVAVAIDGNRAMAGAWQNDTGGLEAGAIYLSGGGDGAGNIQDCNQNGIDDSCDIASGVSDDVNSNGIPDECEPPPSTCPADVHPPGGNGAVDVDDLIAVILAWGPCPPAPQPCPADTNASGAVDVDDLIAVILAWGACPE